MLVEFSEFSQEEGLYKTIKIIEKNQNVVEFCLSRPEVSNAYNNEMIDELLNALSRLNERTKVLVISGDGNNFQAGADLEWLRKASNKDAEFNLQLSENSFEFFDCLRRLSIPVVAKIQGFCGGGGTGIVASCDMAIASNDSVFSISEVRWGMTPSIIFPALYSSIGAKNIARYALTGDKFDATKALEIGLISDITQPHLLDKSLEMIIDSIMRCSASAVKLTKKELLKCSNWDILKKTFIKTHAEQRMSIDAKKGLDAFKRKKEPDWT